VCPAFSVKWPPSPTDLPSTLHFATYQSLQGGEKQGSVSDRLSKCEGDFQFERQIVRKGWKAKALGRCFSHKFTKTAPMSPFIFRNFVKVCLICRYRVMQGSASLALEHRCIGLFTSSFILFWYGSFNLATKVGVFVPLVQSKQALLWGALLERLSI